MRLSRKEGGRFITLHVSATEETFPFREKVFWSGMFTVPFSANALTNLTTVLCRKIRQLGIVGTLSTCGRLPIGPPRRRNNLPTALVSAVSPTPSSTANPRGAYYCRGGADCKRRMENLPAPFRRCVLCHRRIGPGGGMKAVGRPVGNRPQVGNPVGNPPHKIRRLCCRHMRFTLPGPPRA